MYGVPNMGVVEGWAEAATWQRYELDPHQWSAVLRRLKLAPDVRDLLAPTGFYKAAGPTAYTLVGSFFRFVLEKHGVESARALYRTGDFEASIGMDLSQAVAAWETHVDAVELPAEAEGLAHYYYDRKSIFSRACARWRGAQVSEYNRAMAEFDFVQATDVAIALECAFPHDPRVALKLAEAQRQRGDLDGARERIDALGAQQSVPMDTSLRISRLRVCLLQGDGGCVDKELAALGSRTLPFASQRYIALLRASRTSEAGKRYLLGAKPGTQLADALIWARSKEPEACYAAANHLLRAGRTEVALEFVECLGSWPADASKALVMDALRLEGMVYLMAGKSEEAAASFDRVLGMRPPGGIRSEVTDWRARVDVFDANRQR